MALTSAQCRLPDHCNVGGGEERAEFNFKRSNLISKYQIFNWRCPYSKILHKLSLMVIINFVCCLVAKLCLGPYDPIDCSLPGFSVHGISQSRVLEWVAIFFSRGSSWLRDRTGTSYVASVQISSVQSPGLPVHHQLPESIQTHVHWVGDAIQPSHPLLSPSPPALTLFQHQGLFKWVSSSPLIHTPNIPGSYAILLFIASNLASITSPIHNWVLFLLWLHPFILSGVILHWSPVAYWAPTDLGSSAFSVLSFCLFILFMGFSGKNTKVVCLSLPQWTTVCQTSPSLPVCLVSHISLNSLCLCVSHILGSCNVHN